MVQYVKVKGQLEAGSSMHGGGWVGWSKVCFNMTAICFPFIYQRGHERKTMLGHLWKQRGREGVRRSSPVTDGSS